MYKTSSSVTTGMAKVLRRGLKEGGGWEEGGLTFKVENDDLKLFIDYR